MGDVTKSMTGKVCMVTGATAGIGAATAQALAQQGATVIVVGRNPEKGGAAVERIKHRTGNHQVAFLLADLSVQYEIHQLVQQFKSCYHRLDVLVNNAAALFATRQLSVDGIEMTFAVNHLSYFLLTNLLLDTLRASTPARIINVSSHAHAVPPLPLAALQDQQRHPGRSFWKNLLLRKLNALARLSKKSVPEESPGEGIDFDNLQGQHHYLGWRVYGLSKLANILFTYELARRLEGTGITVNALDPGVVATNALASSLRLRGVGWLGRLLFELKAVNSARGAATTVYLATSPDVEGITGEYFVGKKTVPSSTASYDKVAAQQLWQLSMELTGLSVSAQVDEYTSREKRAS